MKILLVEDNTDLARQTRVALEGHGHTVDTAADGEQGSFLEATEAYDAVVLDIGLPRLDGLSILRDMRAAGRHTPVLLLTARSGWRDRVDGLDAGADDYLCKPFQMEELLARVRALIRRSAGRSSTLMIEGDLALDTRQGQVFLREQPVSLTSQEFKVLSYFMHHPGELISRIELSEHLYGHNGDRDSNTIEVFVRRLRQKIGADMIDTVRGLGYRFGRPA